METVTVVDNSKVIMPFMISLLTLYLLSFKWAMAITCIIEKLPYSFPHELIC